MSGSLSDCNIVRPVRDVLITIEEGERPRASIERQLREAIRSGLLQAGAALPSSRSLAADLSVARSTVVEAYEQLAVEGYLIAQQGRATTVASLGAPAVETDDVNPLGPTYRYDLRPGEPSVGSFPRAEWRRATRRILDEAPDDAFGYGDPRGRIELRTALSEYLARVRGVHVDLAGLRIYGGHVQALGFIAEALRMQGVSRVAVEDAMLFFHRQVLEIVGLEVVSVPVDGQGVCADALAQLDVGAVFVTPANNFPFAVTMSSQRRNDLLAWARSQNAWVVEDDYDGEFRYDRRPIGSLQGLDPERVLYSGTASKAIAPSLRISWLVVPPGLRQELAIATHMRAGVSSLSQLVLADLIERGAYDRHVRKQRAIYRRRAQQLSEILSPIEWLDVPNVDAGMHMFATLKGDSPGETAIIQAAEAASVGLLGMQTHLGHSSEALVIGFSRPSDHQATAAFEALAEVLVSAYG